MHLSKTNLFLVITLSNLILLFTPVYGQNFEPLELAQKIFAKDTFPNIENYITGEYKGRPNGQDLEINSKTKFSLLGNTDKKAVVNMTIWDSLGKGLDTYLHFEKDTIWKMVAFRALAMTGIIEHLKNELENLSPQQVEEMIELSKENKDSENILFSTRDEYNFMLGNFKLTLDFDDNIVNHFLTNQTEFERLKNLALTELQTIKVDKERSMELIENYRADYNNIYISKIMTGGYELGNCINFLIGGMIDNSVGYFYINDKKEIPQMNPERIIMIREIGNGWYIYKTT
jgi:hypothetical protein